MKPHLGIVATLFAAVLIVGSIFLVRRESEQAVSVRKLVRHEIAAESACQELAFDLRAAAKALATESPNPEVRIGLNHDGALVEHMPVIWYRAYLHNSSIRRWQSDAEREADSAAFWADIERASAQQKMPLAETLEKLAVRTEVLCARPLD